MRFDIETIDFALQRYNEMLKEGAYERMARQYGGHMPRVGEVLRPYLERMAEGLARQAELCLEAGPACEMPYYA